MKTTILFIINVIFLSHVSFSQGEQEAYLSAKQHLSVGSYNLAMESFKQLSDPNSKHDFVVYSSFYYGLAAFKNGDLGLARSMWLHVERKYPNWNKIKDVYFWLAQVYFEEGSYERGTEYAKKSNASKQEGLIHLYVSEIADISELEQLNQQFPEDKTIAMILAKAISNQPITTRDFSKLEQISSKFNLDQTAFGLPDIGSSIKKQTYNVAVLLPFMFESLDNTTRVSRNKFVMDIYQGILEAVDTLNSGRELISIYPYDTKRSVRLTNSILNKEELKSMDLIIGPLFPDPSKAVSDFCFEYKINMINPVSSNNQVINNNPYSFLFKSSNETKSLKMAEYASATFTNKNAFIFYDNTEKDSIAAYIYKNKIEREGFEVLQCLNVDDEKIGVAHGFLTHTYEVALNKKERDSVVIINKLLVKSRKPKPGDRADSIFYYQEFFTIAHDSIGHMFVSSAKPLHASSFISAIEIRSDTIPVLTNAAWMDFEMLTINQLERLSVKFIDPNHIDFDKISYFNFSKKIERKYRKHPTLNNCIGYELMFYVGQMMRQYGSYFQKGALLGGRVEGQIFDGIDYGAFNSNQYVPILKFEKAVLINVREQ